MPADGSPIYDKAKLEELAKEHISLERASVAARKADVDSQQLLRDPVPEEEKTSEPKFAMAELSEWLLMNNKLLRLQVCLQILGGTDAIRNLFDARTLADLEDEAKELFASTSLDHIEPPSQD
ncbi:MAG: hypothetical protein STHCBS139747_006861 [Sporothrix thermara]